MNTKGTAPKCDDVVECEFDEGCLLTLLSIELM